MIPLATFPFYIHKYIKDPLVCIRLPYLSDCCYLTALNCVVLMLLSAIKAHRSGLMQTDRLRWTPSLSQQVGLSLQTFLFFTMFDMFRPCSAAPEHAIQLRTCHFLPFLRGLLVSPSWWIPKLSLSPAVLWHFIQAARKKTKKKPQKNVSSQELRTQSRQQLQGYLFISRCGVTAAMSLSAHVGVPDMEIELLYRVVFCNSLPVLW